MEVVVSVGKVYSEHVVLYAGRLGNSQTSICDHTIQIELSPLSYEETKIILN